MWKQIFAILLLAQTLHTNAEDPSIPNDLTASAGSDDAAAIAGSALNAPSGPGEECEPDMIGFELITGYVFSAPNDTIESIPGTLMLTDCLEACQAKDTCEAVNYETGLCVLFSSNADEMPDALTRSQFPVFTIYAQKSCLGVRPCERAWCIDRVQGYKLNGYKRASHGVMSRQHCVELCLGETEFTCRSANYNNATGECELSAMDRFTVAGSNAFQPSPSHEYLENNCAEEPTKLCEFKKLKGRILKTVDSVYQDVGSLEECRDLCLNSPYRCHSYDYGDTGDMVCRLSHHSRATLSDIQEPYLDVPEAATYELNSCYNVTVYCHSGDMVARIRTSKLFNGKIYSKGSPNSCVKDVNGSLEFDLRMAYDDIECNVRKIALGRYVNDVVIQHHDTIVTSSDLGLAVTCQYDLTNKTVANEFDLGVHGDIEPSLTEEVVVDSPNVAMKITDRNGDDVIPSAEVGDPLALKFEIMDPNSPFEIFVRELVAMDGVDSSEIVLIDSRGCPTDQLIMGPLYKSVNSGKALLSHFDAFKFPSSEVVQFRALVTPCMPTCAPVNCTQEDPSGELRSIKSYGRRRRRSASYSKKSQNPAEDLLLVQSIHITDKFDFDKKQNNRSRAETVFMKNIDDVNGYCLNIAGLIISGTLFLAAQLAIIVVWSFLWQRRKNYYKECRDNMSFTTSLQASSVNMSVPRTDSLCKLYDNAYTHARRF